MKNLRMNWNGKCQKQTNKKHSCSSIRNLEWHFSSQTSFYANMSGPWGLIISDSDMNMACNETLQEPAAPFMTASLWRELFPVCWWSGLMEEHSTGVSGNTDHRRHSPHKGAHIHPTELTSSFINMDSNLLLTQLLISHPSTGEGSHSTWNNCIFFH